MTTHNFTLHLFFAHLSKKTFLAGSALLLLPSLTTAQQVNLLPDAPVPQLIARADQPQEQSSQAPPSDVATVTIPAGTRLQLVLTHPVNSNSSSRGDQIFAQTSAPVIVDDQVVIPGGTYVQGSVEKLSRNGTRAEMLMQSVSLVFPNGYVAKAGGPANIESEEWTAANNPPARSKAAIVLAPLLGVGLGMGIGAAIDKPHTTTLSAPSIPASPGFPPSPPTPSLPPLTMTENSHKGLAIGGIVGSLAGAGISFALIARSHQFYIEEASPMSMTLPHEITLPRAQVNDANAKAATLPVPVRVSRTRATVAPSTTNGTCYFPGSAGTPDTHIPGTPGVNGAPGTPDIDIPGTPATPPLPYPCP